MASIWPNYNIKFRSHPLGLAEMILNHLFLGARLTKIKRCLFGGQPTLRKVTSHNVAIMSGFGLSLSVSNPPALGLRELMSKQQNHVHAPYA
jgi:hypothetical protein